MAVLGAGRDRQIQVQYMKMNVLVGTVCPVTLCTPRSANPVLSNSPDQSKSKSTNLSQSTPNTISGCTSQGPHFICLPPGMC